MWERFIKAMEYRSYCMAIRELRNKGLDEEVARLIDYKHQLYSK